MGHFLENNLTVRVTVLKPRIIIHARIVLGGSSRLDLDIELLFDKC